MTFNGEVLALASIGEAVRVTIGNLRADRAADWREYSPTTDFAVLASQAKAFPIGRRVRVTLEPR